MPHEDEEPGVVDDEVEVLLSRRCVPADGLIPGGALPRRGREAQKGEDLIVGLDEVPELRARQGRIPEVVVPVDVGVPQGARSLVHEYNIEVVAGRRA